MAASQMTLPNGVVTRADVGRLAKEAETLDSALNAASIRGNGAELPKTSQLLDEMAGMNKLNLLHSDDRQHLLQFLQKIRNNAPTIHMSFNTDPSPRFQQSLITWIRKEINPAILLQIGLHPNIGAGCVVRTTNKFFDFSLRQRFTDQRELLISKLRGDETVAPAAVAVETEQPLPVVPTEPVEKTAQAPAEKPIETPKIAEAEPEVEQKIDHSDSKDAS